MQTHPDDIKDNQETEDPFNKQTEEIKEHDLIEQKETDELVQPANRFRLNAEDLTCPPELKVKYRADLPSENMKKISLFDETKNNQSSLPEKLTKLKVENNLVLPVNDWKKEINITLSNIRDMPTIPTIRHKHTLQIKKPSEFNLPKHNHPEIVNYQNQKNNHNTLSLNNERDYFFQMFKVLSNENTNLKVLTDKVCKVSSRIIDNIVDAKQVNRDPKKVYRDNDKREKRRNDNISSSKPKLPNTFKIKDFNLKNPKERDMYIQTVKQDLQQLYQRRNERSNMEDYFSEVDQRLSQLEKKRERYHEDEQADSGKENKKMVDKDTVELDPVVSGDDESKRTQGDNLRSETKDENIPAEI